MDWVGTDIFSTAPNWTNLNRLYEGYKHKPFVIGEYAPMGEDDAPYVGDDPTFSVSHFPGVRSVLRGRLAGGRFPEYATGAAGDGPGGIPTPMYAFGPRDQRAAGGPPP